MTSKKLSIKYIEGGKELLNDVKPLWEKQREHHEAVSPYFREHFANHSFEKRKEELLKKSKNGLIKVFLVKEVKDDMFIGYCIATIDECQNGEIDSIYVEPEYRNRGIATELMAKTIDWMKSYPLKSRKLIVAVGNEEVIDFYKKFNFYPRSVILEEKKGN